MNLCPSAGGVSHQYTNDPSLFLPSGAALGPLLAGLLSAGGWNQVFYMLMTADFLALLVRVSKMNKYLIVVLVCLCVHSYGHTL